MRIDGVVTEISRDREVKAILKAKRSEIRLKYSLLADQEISDVIPALERQLLASVESGDTALSIGVADA